MSNVDDLSVARCRELLAEGVVGRVAVCAADGAHVVPVNYTVIDDAIIFRTSAYGVVANHDWRQPMAFEIDHLDHAEQRGWSVVARGRAERVDDLEELDWIKRSADPRPWASGPRQLYVRLEWAELTGRRLAPGWTQDHQLPDQRPPRRL